VTQMTLCKLTGQPAASIPDGLGITDLITTPDPTLPLGGCGSAAAGAGSSSGTPGDTTGLPGVLPSLSPLPVPSLPPIVP